MTRTKRINEWINLTKCIWKLEIHERRKVHLMYKLFSVFNFKWERLFRLNFWFEIEKKNSEILESSWCLNIVQRQCTLEIKLHKDWPFFLIPIYKHITLRLFVRLPAIQQYKLQNARAKSIRNYKENIKEEAFCEQY